MKETPPNAETPDEHEHESLPESDHVILMLLRASLASNDREEIQRGFELLRDAIHGDSQITKPDVCDREIDEYLETGRIRIDVGPGSHGQRIYIEGGRMYMNVDEQHPKYTQRFRTIFELPEDAPLEVQL